MVETSAELLLAVGQCAAVLASAYLLSLRVDPEASTRIRVAGTLVAAMWLPTALFFALSPFGAFDRLGTSACLALVTLALLRGAQGDARLCLRRRVVEDLRAAAQPLRNLARAPGRWWLVLGTVAVCSALLPRVLRATVAPVAGWDALTYHLFRAGRWVQAGGLVLEPTPGAGGYYAYYPPVGDILWSWLLLPTHDHALVWLGGAAGIVGVALGAYVAARELGADRIRAVWAGFVLLATPAVGAYVTALYVDVMLLATTLLAVSLLARAVQAPTRGSIALCAAALGLAAGIKTTGVVVLGIGMVALAWTAARRLAPAERARTAVAVGVVLTVGLMGHAVCLVHHGNPLYPFPVSILGVELFAGNEENTLLHRGALFPPEVLRFEPVAFVRALFGVRSAMWSQHLNLGPASVLVFPLALGGWVWAREGAARRTCLVVVVALLAVFALKLGSRETLVLRTISAQGIGRFLSIPFAFLVLMATRGPRRLVTPAFVLMTLVGAVLTFPRGWAPVDTHALQLVVPKLLLGAALAGLAGLAVFGGRRIRSPRLRRPALGCAVACAGIAAVGTHDGLSRLRTELAPDYLAAMNRGQTYDPHPLDPKATDAWPIWVWLDAQAPQTIAFASGWDGKGQHWFRSPLLGEDLQHEVLYVSPIAGGAFVDYRLADEVAQRADLGAWVQGLIDADVDLVVLAVPPSVEHGWVMQHPDVFEPVQVGERQLVVAFRFHPERAVAR